MTNDLIMKAAFGRQTTGTAERGLLLMLGACLLLLGWKAWMITRLNVNWDEFFFLTHVHALLRGELEVPFQTAYTQLFRWLPWVGATEMPQIYAGRVVMLALLVVAVAQILRLAARWVSPGAAAVAAIAFLCTLPVQRHGASFRSDSMMLPLLLGIILLLTRAQHSRRTDLVAGVLCGAGIALNVKMTLFAPLLIACVFLAEGGAMPLAVRLRTGLVRCLIIGAATLASAALLIGLHQLTLQVAQPETAATFADHALEKTVLETRFMPGKFYFFGLSRSDRVIWICLAVGLAIALWRRRWQAAAMALALLPILFYRNTFPYFYVVMLAPAAVLVALLADEVRTLARRGATGASRDWVPLACGGLLLVHGGMRLPWLSIDEQRGQRLVLDAVHAIFPQAVPYMDHAGMVSTFRKVNFFMSTWGMDLYRRRGTSFVAPALRDFRPPLLIVNRDFLDARSPEARTLLPLDRDLLLRFYQPYWGPVYVAGASAELDAGEARPMLLPFPGAYRVSSAEPLVIDGVARKDGDVIEVAGENVQVTRTASAATRPLAVRLLWAQARPAPSHPPDFSYIFTGL